MKVRLVTAVCLAGALLLGTSGAEAAAPKTLDGKTLKTLTLKYNAGTQSHDSDNVTDLKYALGDTPDRADCKAPRCARLPFVYKPAKGVKGNIAFEITWTNQASDFDLYVAEVFKDGSSSTIDNCGGSTGTRERLYLPASNFRAGKTYALVADNYRSVSDTVTLKLSMPGTDQIKKTVPAQYDGQFPGTVYSYNCTQ